MVVSGLSNAVAVSGGSTHSCALLLGGTVKCLGDNTIGQLGTGNLVSSLTPVAVVGMTNAVAIGAIAGYSCAVLATGTVKCWGDNTDGELDNGTTVGSTTPVTVSGLVGAATTQGGLAAGGFNACAVLASGGAKCWGNNTYGQLGDGTNLSSTTPVAVSGLCNTVAITVGDEYSCAVLSGGTVKCWGFNTHGQLGNATTTNESTPVAVSGLVSATAIATGSDDTCAVSAGGEKCWGGNSVGELGDGTTTDSSTPVAVSGAAGAIAVAASGNVNVPHSCAIFGTDTAKCWGDTPPQQADARRHARLTAITRVRLSDRRVSNNSLLHLLQGVSCSDMLAVEHLHR